MTYGKNITLTPAWTHCHRYRRWEQIFPWLPCSWETWWYQSKLLSLKQRFPHPNFGIKTLFLVTAAVTK